MILEKLLTRSAPRVLRAPQPRTSSARRLRMAVLRAYASPHLAARLCSLQGKENLPRDGKPVIIVGNHQSSLDSCLMPCAVRELNFKVVFKRELLLLPGMGTSMWLAGYLSVDRRNKESGKQLMLECAEAAQSGCGTLWFPEGTRLIDGSGGRLGPFKLGAFIVARDAGAAVLPVTISGARRIMPGNALSMGWGRAIVTVHPPIPSAGKSVEELANAARLSIESALRDVDDLPVPPPRAARGGASTVE